MVKKRHYLKISSNQSQYCFIGISAHCRDYTLGFHLHQKMGLIFQKKDDFRGFSFYSCPDENGFYHYYLLGNRSEESVLIPEFRQMDFLFIMDGPVRKTWKETIIKGIRGIPNVIMAFEIASDSIKNFEPLQHELEMHISGLSRHSLSLT